MNIIYFEFYLIHMNIFYSNLFREPQETLVTEEIIYKIFFCVKTITWHTAIPYNNIYK